MHSFLIFPVCHNRYYLYKYTIVIGEIKMKVIIHNPENVKEFEKQYIASILDSYLKIIKAKAQSDKNTHGSV